MSLFFVDEKKCKRDGICADICPRSLIVQQDSTCFPQPIDGAAELCSRCGHCVAVCPNGALSHSAMTPDLCPPVRSKWRLDDRRAEHFLRARRSIRNYKDKIVEHDILTRLIDIARYAPSGGNAQPVHWLVIYDSKEVKRLAGMVVDWMRNETNTQRQPGLMAKFSNALAAWDAGEERICRGAPHIIIAHAHREAPGDLSACLIAMSYLELAAPSLGLGGVGQDFLRKRLTPGLLFRRPYYCQMIMSAMEP